MFRRPQHKINLKDYSWMAYGNRHMLRTMYNRYRTYPMLLSRKRARKEILSIIKIWQEAITGERS